MQFGRHFGRIGAVLVVFKFLQKFRYCRVISIGIESFGERVDIVGDMSIFLFLFSPQQNCSQKHRDNYRGYRGHQSVMKMG